jgi:hypothetical protein
MNDRGPGEIPHEEGSGNVFADLGLDDADARNLDFMCMRFLQTPARPSETGKLSLLPGEKA